MEIRNVLLTPEIAKEWLSTMPSYQRTPSKYTVTEYANDITNGRWVSGTGDAIRFNKQGEMIDGQHRCLAVIESGIAINVIVIDDLDNEVYMVLDRGKKRSAGDTIIAPNGNIRAAIAKCMIGLNYGVPIASLIGGNVSKKEHLISATEVAEFANKNEKAVSDIVSIYLNFKASQNGRFSTGVATVLISYAIKKTGTLESIKKFSEDLLLPVAERPVVCTMVRERSSSFTVAKGTNKNLPVFAIFLVGFDNWFGQKTPKILQTNNIAKNLNEIPVKRDWGHA